MRIAIINGPNLNLTGLREPGIYGITTFDALLLALPEQFPEVEFTYFQSNIEGEIIDKLQESGFSSDGIILNSGGYTHTSVAIGDAVRAITSPVIEVHLSNVFAREEFRHTSFVAPHARGVIAGFGMDSYLLAIRAFVGKSV